MFQSFRANSWNHPKKYLILAGYGIIATLTLAFYYFKSTRMAIRIEFRSAGREALDFARSCNIEFGILELLSPLGIRYAFLLLKSHIFIGNFCSVALLPVSAYIFFYLYEQYKILIKSHLMPINAQPHVEQWKLYRDWSASRY